MENSVNSSMSDMAINRSNNRSESDTAQYINADVEERAHREILQKTEKNKLIDRVIKQKSIINKMVSHIDNLIASDNEENNRNRGGEGIEGNLMLIQNNIDILKNRNDRCKDANQLRHKSSKLFESSARIQFVLFTLFILVLMWLLYHYMMFDKN
jgi:hypothetical protein